MVFDELDGLHDERLIALENLIRQKEITARFYDSWIKNKSFKVDDLVWKVILPIDMSRREYGKWSPKWEGQFKVTEVFYENACTLIEINSGYEISSINGKYLKSYWPTMYEVNIDKLWVNKDFYLFTCKSTRYSVGESITLQKFDG